MRRALPALMSGRRSSMGRSPVLSSLLMQWAFAFGEVFTVDGGDQR